MSLGRVALPAAVALSLAFGAGTASAGHDDRSSAACRPGYYLNVSHHCVRRPGHSPAGATARCRDGDYSYSEHAQGTCSGHGGVAVWIHHP